MADFGDGLHNRSGLGVRSYMVNHALIKLQYIEVYFRQKREVGVFCPKIINCDRKSRVSQFLYYRFHIQTIHIMYSFCDFYLHILFQNSIAAADFCKLLYKRRFPQ